MEFDSVIGIPSRFIPHRYAKTTICRSVNELSGFFKIFDIGNFREFVVLFDGHLNIFGILEEILKKEQISNVWQFKKLAETYFESFRTFYEKLSSVKNLFIHHLCAPTAGPKDVYSLLSLSSFNTFEFFIICECKKTKILTNNIITKLIWNNPKLTKLFDGSSNIKFLENVFKEFFTMNQPRRMESECDYNDISLVLKSTGKPKYLYNSIKNSLSELRM